MYIYVINKQIIKKILNPNFVEYFKNARKIYTNAVEYV